MDWKEIWTLPLKDDEMGYAWAANNTMALTSEWDELDDLKLIGEVVDAVNGTKEFSRGGKWTAEGCDIYCDGTLKFYIRGWGELTSPSCLGLSSEEAAKVQDEFASFIISKLNKES